MKDRVILHCDLNNFFASVEILKNPELRGKAVAVCGDPKMRHGIVLAKSEPAKKCGVKTGMPIWQAKQLCPNIVIVSTNHSDYNKYSKLARELYYRFTDLVEPFGCDECWLDVTGSLKLFKSTPFELAETIRNTMREELGLTISVGVSWTKTFAKLASDIKKPDATTEITRDNYRDIIWKLPITDFLNIGRKTAKVLEKQNILSVGDLAVANAEVLRGHLGIGAYKLIDAANGVDDDPVSLATDKHEIKSVGNGTTLHRNLLCLSDVSQVLYLLSEEIAYRMRKKGVKGTTVTVSVRGVTLEWISTQETIAKATSSAKNIHANALEIFKKMWRLPESDPVTKKIGNHAQGVPQTNVGGSPVMTSASEEQRSRVSGVVMSLRVKVSNLVTDEEQICFFDETNEKDNDKLGKLFDKIRAKYGTESIMFGTGITGEFKLDFEVIDEFHV
ncbi:MAG: DNA polymerase IV [Firmicutes bacterium]|nr:DNA polymerase IV [Bacillota bacterium]